MDSFLLRVLDSGGELRGVVTHLATGIERTFASTVELLSALGQARDGEPPEPDVADALQEL